jgi:flagellum-specific ATP synthase
MTDAVHVGADLLHRAGNALQRSDLARRRGRVSNLIGLVIEAIGMVAEVGEVCLIHAGRDRAPVAAEVVGFREDRTLLMPLGELQGIGPGTQVEGTGAPFRIAVGDALLGRVLDGLGRPIDFAPEVPQLLSADLAEDIRQPTATADMASLANASAGVVLRSTTAQPPEPLSRPRISERVGLGVRALDGLVPCGRGQRLGIFAGSGVGKSSLMGMIARSSGASVNVIALVGERGREVREFIERDLGDALERSVVVVATSDQPALVRIKAAFTATAVAEHFRDQGHDVMLMMDSVTRFAMAQREVGLAIGEPPTTRGYTPSVFALLPRLLERAGTHPHGTITGLYTVLVDGDDMNEPIADAVRAILDGHVVLTRSLAHAAHYPAIDVLQSVSRLASEIVPAELTTAGQRVRSALAALREKEDLISIGAYRPGQDPELDAALAHRERINAYLRQPVDEASTPESADTQLSEIAASLEEALARPEAYEEEAEVLDAEPISVPTGDPSAPFDAAAAAIPALRL